MMTLKGSSHPSAYLLRFDGGSNPNPGPCAGAFVLYDNKGTVIKEGGKFIEKGTNNIGEYTGLLIGLQKCVEMNIRNVHIEGDSLLVISQIAGKWKVKNENLAVIHSAILSLFQNFDNLTCKHIMRTFNCYADSLSDKTLSMKESF
jgi:ribonuclease HI